MSWMLPESISTFGPDVDRLYYVILWVTGLIFVATEGALVYFVVRYRHREGRKAEYIHGSTKAEIVWTATPFLVCLALAFYSRGVWDTMKNPASVPANALEYVVEARQFEWDVTYAGPDGALDTADDVSTLNAMHVPVDQPVRITLIADDVLHSFFLPDLRVKQDAVPGMEITVWFEATATGEYPIGCAELCGIGHTTMSGTLTVHAAADFDDWVLSQAGDQEDD